MTNPMNLERVSDHPKSRRSLLDRIAKLEAVLREHHEWLQSADWLFMFYVNPKTGRIENCDISGEYSDSSLCKKTVAVLKGEQI